MKWGAPDILPWLWLFLPAALVLFAVQRRRLRLVARLIQNGLWPSLAPDWMPRRIFGRLVLWLLAMFLFALALARPQWGFTWREIKRSGLDIMVVADTSRSMLAPDLKPNRLQQIKWGIRDLLNQLVGDRVGLVIYSGASYLQCPLTLDYSALMLYANDLNTRLVPRGGTDIADALRTAIKAFDEGSEADRLIVLLSDGEFTTGNPLEVVDALKENNVRVYAIGVGSLEGELIPVRDEEGRESFLRDSAGNVVKSTLNETPLKELALATGGAYVRATPGQFGFERLVKEEWSKLKPSTGDAQRIKMYEDRAGWFIGVGLFLLAIEAIRSERKRGAKNAEA